MVMFVCNMCGESLKKNKVEEHYRFKCRNCETVSCMDCGKDFWGDDYVQHNKCISEQEKYQGTPTDYKGDNKQEQWVANVTTVIASYSGNPKVRSLLEMCVQCPNLPRKQKKFVNFVRSSFNERNQTVVGEAWEIIEKASKLDINDKTTPASDKPETETKDSKVQTESDSKSGENAPTENEVNENMDENGNESGDSESEETGKIMEKKREKTFDGVESEKAKKKRLKQEKKEQLAILQNADGKKMSKKQLKRLREESISVELGAVAEEVPALNGLNGDATKKDKKNKKKQREHKESVHEVINENGEEVENEMNGKQDFLAQIRLDEKLMKGIPKNENIEGDEDNDEEEKRDRHFNWHKAIKTALKAEDDLSLPMKKLRKKVLAEFMTYGGDGKFKNENEIWALFDKKLHSYPKVKILKDKVTFIK
ncbi:cell growth-regulating nucleolar protein-like isoform X2 [Symsagittifera roscoffensis]|uniref:cell growth-regulating nucleolar protein-like isoform X2 n=1 Tax=Symsagittifera roscoffensis TaxID=84072 RepID=UPI00307B9B06